MTPAEDLGDPSKEAVRSNALPRQTVGCAVLLRQLTRAFGVTIAGVIHYVSRSAALGAGQTVGRA